MVPLGTKIAASREKTRAAEASRRLTVGSSPYTSSPTSASAIARRIAGVGRVTVSLRRSITALTCVVCSCSSIVWDEELFILVLAYLLCGDEAFEDFVGKQAAARSQAKVRTVA